MPKTTGNIGGQEKEAEPVTMFCSITQPWGKCRERGFFNVKSRNKNRRLLKLSYTGSIVSIYIMCE